MKQIFTLFIVASLFCGTSAFAQNPLAPVNGFNVMVRKNLTISSNETDGPIAVGGNLIIEGGYQVNIHDKGTFMGGESKVIGLYIDGRIYYNKGGTVKIGNNRYVKIGDLTGSVVNNGQHGTETTKIVKETSDKNNERSRNPNIELALNQPAASVSINPANKLDIEGIFQQLQDNSTLIGNCESSVEIYDTDKSGNANKGKITTREIPASGRVEIKLEANKVNFLNITGEQLNKINTLVFKDNFKPNATTPFVINVLEGESINWNAPDLSGVGDQDAQYILFNFPVTKNLSLTSRNNTIRGTILAPTADFTKTISSNIDGQIVALSYNQSGGENHYQLFSGDVKGCHKSLPVELTSFKAQANDQQQTQLTWTTARELNSSHFTVQRSSDGRNFETIRTVAAQGKSNSVVNYSLTDANPAYGVNYYRLIQVDLDGTAHSLRMVSVVVDSPENRLHAVFPNPNRGESFAVRVQDTDTQVKMMSSQGIEISVSTQALESRTLRVTPNHPLQAGTYLLRIQDRTGVYTKKVTIL